MTRVVAAGTCPDILYVFKPAKQLPVIDLSKSLRGELLPAKLNDVSHRFLTKYHQPLLVANVTAFIMISFIAVVDARTGQFLSLIAIFLWTPLGLGAFSTLRYDVVLLLMGTFDFWFFSFVTSMTAGMISAYFRDLRFLRMIIDWVGFHHIVCIDAHVRGVRDFALMTIVGIPPVLFMLVWIMLGHVDACTSFSLLDYENENRSFHLSGVDVIGNGLLSQKLQREKEQRCRRTGDQFFTVRAKVRRRGVGANRKKVMLRETNVIQKMRFVKSPHVFNASHVVFPLHITNGIYSAWYLLPLYAVGAVGVLLSFSVFLGTLSGIFEAWSAFLWTLIFILIFFTLYQRQLLKLLVTSFDFLFYVFQITAANLSVCILSGWEISRCVMMATWEIWFLWALTLDALTPVIKDKLRFRAQFAAPVVALVLLAHIVIMSRIFFVGDETLQDTVIFEGVIWNQPVVVRVMPFYFSRVVTLALWCPRLIWRFAMLSKTEIAIIRGAVCYNNCISKRNRQYSRAAAKKNKSRDRVAPAVHRRKRGPIFFALTLDTVSPKNL